MTEDERKAAEARDRNVVEAAARALAEAAARRANAKADADRPAERGGPAGPEPTRYGDWEVKGVVSDF